MPQIMESTLLLSVLSSEPLGKMLEKSELLTPVQLRARLGVETALRLRRDEDLARLGQAAHNAPNPHLPARLKRVLFP